MIAILRNLQAGADKRPEELVRLFHPDTGPDMAERHVARVVQAWTQVWDDARLGAELDWFARVVGERLGPLEPENLHRFWRWQGSPEPKARPEDEHEARRAAAVWATWIDNTNAMVALHVKQQAQQKQEAARQAAEQRLRQEEAALRAVARALRAVRPSHPEPKPEHRPRPSGPRMGM